MELSKEVIDAQGFSTDQVTAINTFGLAHANTRVEETIATYDGKANKDSEGIMNGMITYAQEKNGLTLERQEKEKGGDSDDEEPPLFESPRMKNRARSRRRTR